MTDIPAELYERMAKLIHQMASMDGAAFVSEYKDEARAIVALLPEPVDPDLIEAREQEAVAEENAGFSEYAAKVRRGECDDDARLRCRYEGIKRGRELALASLTQES